MSHVPANLAMTKGSPGALQLGYRRAQTARGKPSPAALALLAQIRAVFPFGLCLANDLFIPGVLTSKE